MARNDGKNNKTTKPTHNIVLTKTLPSGQTVTFKLGLFTDNNSVHNKLSELTAEKVKAFISSMTVTLAEYGEVDLDTDNIDLGI